MLSEYLAIGEITKPQGVRGEVKLRPLTCDISRFEGLEEAYFRRGGEYIPVRLSMRSASPEAVFLTVGDSATREEAEKLRGELLYIDRARAVELGEDENFICDLIGLRGVTDEGEDIGELTDVLQPGGNDVYVFSGPKGEALVPALKSVVTRVDAAGGRVYLNAKRLGETAVLP